MSQRLNISKETAIQYLELLPINAVYFTIAISIWLIYYPANMSPDSLNQYRQAVSGIYDDWHPPIMAFVLKLFLKAGLNIGALMLVQCITGVFGIRSLSKAVLNILFKSKKSKYMSELLALLTLIVLLCPLTPLLPYLMTFWKDCWLMIIMIWISSIVINSCSYNQNLPSKISVFRLCILISLTTLALLVRHNAMIIAPVIVLLIFLLTKNSYKHPVLIALCPIVLYTLFSVFQYSYLNVKKTHPGRKVYVVDLVTICYEDMEICNNLNFINKKINFNNLDKFVYGDIDNIFYKSMIVNRSIIWGDNAERLEQEYIDTLFSYPFSIIRIKVKTFLELIKIKPPKYWFFDFMMQNRFNLQQSNITSKYRHFVRRNLTRVSNSYLRFFSQYHIIWLCFNIIILYVLIFKYVIEKKSGLPLLILTGLIPLSYYLSYLIAVFGYDFRFMYPSTILIQVFVLNIFFYCLYKLIEYAHLKITHL